MKYGKGTCAECKRSVMTTDDGRAIAHPPPGGIGQCDGSAEPTEQVAREAAKPKPMVAPAMPPAAPAPTNGALSFKIEKGIPIPKIKTGKQGRFRGALLAMEVGDSFALPCNGKRAMESNVRDAAKKAGVRIAIRRIDAGSVRVWRTG